MVGGSKLSLEIKANSVSGMHIAENNSFSCRWDQGKDAWVELQGLQHWQQELEGGDHRLMLVDWYSPACKGCETAFPALTQVARDEELKRWVALLDSAGRWRGVAQVTAHWAPQMAPEPPSPLQRTPHIAPISLEREACSGQRSMADEATAMTDGQAQAQGWRACAGRLSAIISWAQLSIFTSAGPQEGKKGLATMVGQGSKLTDSEWLTVDMLLTDRHVSGQEARIWAMACAGSVQPPPPSRGV